MTLKAGDIITRVTPEGLSLLSDGDTIKASVKNSGLRTVDVFNQDVYFEETDVKKGDKI